MHDRFTSYIPSSMGNALYINWSGNAKPITSNVCVCCMNRPAADHVYVTPLDLFVECLL